MSTSFNTCHSCSQARLFHFLFVTAGSTWAPRLFRLLLPRRLLLWSYAPSLGHVLRESRLCRESVPAPSALFLDTRIPRWTRPQYPRYLFLLPLEMMGEVSEQGGERTNGVGPVLTNWCWVPAGTTIRSPALTSWSLPLIVALPTPEVKVRAWSTVWTCMDAPC